MQEFFKEIEKTNKFIYIYISLNIKGIVFDDCAIFETVKIIQMLKKQPPCRRLKYHNLLHYDKVSTEIINLLTNDNYCLPIKNVLFLMTFTEKHQHADWVHFWSQSVGFLHLGSLATTELLVH